MPDDHLNAMGRWYKLVRSCDCGSDRPFTHWVKDDTGKPIFKVCERCETKKMKKYREEKDAKDDV